MKNRDFSEELIKEIKDKCKTKGKPITSKEVKFHGLEPIQKEIAIKTINLKYRNFYVCFIDIEKAGGFASDGKHELLIQKKMVHDVLFKLDKNKFKDENIRVIMDKKLSAKHQNALKSELQEHLGTKKGISVQTTASGREKGIQIADIIAGAFRAKLLKKSDLFEIELSKTFQIIISKEEIE